MTRIFNIFAHFYYQFSMPLAFFKIITLFTPLFLHNFNFLLDFNQIFIHMVYFFVPLKRIDFGFDYLMVFVIRFRLICIRIEEINFSFLSFFLLSNFFGVTHRRHNRMCLNFNAINYFILALILRIPIIFSIILITIAVTFFVLGN